MQVLGFIERAKKSGAKVEVGGERVRLGGELSGGHYTTPCVLTDVDDGAEAARDEIFGSVACVFPFDDEEEVIRRANDTPFGLAGKRKATSTCLLHFFHHFFNRWRVYS